MTEQQEDQNYSKRARGKLSDIVGSTAIFLGVILGAKVLGRV